MILQKQLISKKLEKFEQSVHILEEQEDIQSLVECAIISAECLDKPIDTVIMSKKLALYNKNKNMDNYINMLGFKQQLFNNINKFFIETEDLFVDNDLKIDFNRKGVVGIFMADG